MLDAQVNSKARPKAFGRTLGTHVLQGAAVKVRHVKRQTPGSMEISSSMSCVLKIDLFGSVFSPMYLLQFCKPLNPMEMVVWTAIFCPSYLLRKSYR